MNPEPHSKSLPLWKEEFSVHAADERYVNRRQFTKFLALTSLGMLAGQLWIMARSLFKGTRAEPAMPGLFLIHRGELAIGATKQFRYPGPNDPCLLIRLDSDRYVAYSQKCTHLSCAVVYEPGEKRLMCPCHHGFFSAEDGRVLQGPPPRALPQVRLAWENDSLFAVGWLEGGES